MLIIFIFSRLTLSPICRSCWLSLLVLVLFTCFGIFLCFLGPLFPQQWLYRGHCWTHSLEADFILEARDDWELISDTVTGAGRQIGSRPVDLSTASAQMTNTLAGSVVTAFSIVLHRSRALPSVQFQAVSLASFRLTSGEILLLVKLLVLSASSLT